MDWFKQAFLTGEGLYIYTSSRNPDMVQMETSRDANPYYQIRFIYASQ
jgi:hypothetical protein